MAKSKDVKKEVKKEPAKTPKEKKAEKKNKKPKYEQSSYRSIQRSIRFSFCIRHVLLVIADGFCEMMYSYSSQNLNDYKVIFFCDFGYFLWFRLHFVAQSPTPSRMNNGYILICRFHRLHTYLIKHMHIVSNPRCCSQTCQ